MYRQYLILAASKITTTLPVGLLACLGLLLLAGCAAASPTATPSGPSGATSPQTTAQAEIVATSQPAVEPTSTWVPPTALAGTPILGAEATLTAAPQLKEGTVSFTTATGDTVNMTVEIADDEPSRELGLMFRPSLPENAGMLFDFGADTTSSFWMANTILPLSVAFIKADGTVLDIRDMKPLDQSTVSASGPYRYALEANQGFYTAHNIAPGDKATLPGAQSAVIPGMPDCAK